MSRKLPKINTIISNLIYCGIFCLPLTRLGALEIGFTLKISQVFFTLAFLLKLKQIFANKEFKSLKLKLLDILILGFWIIGGISVLQSDNLFVGIVHFIWLSFSVFGIYFTLTRHLLTQEQIEKSLKIFIFSSTLVCLFGLYQFFGDYLDLPTGLRYEYQNERSLGYPRIQSTMLEPLYLANYLFYPIGILMANLLSKKKFFKIETGWICLGLLLHLITLNLTFSRGGWGGLAVLVTIFYLGLILFTLWAREKSLKVFSLLGITLSGIIVLTSILLIPFSQNLGKSLEIQQQQKLRQNQNDEEALISPTGIKESENEENLNPSPTEEKTVDTQPTLTEKITESSQTKEHLETIEKRLLSKIATRDRTLAREQAWELFNKYPIIGVGLGNFGPATGDNSQKLTGFRVVNNQLLNALCETGLAGTIIFMSANILWFILMLRESFHCLKRKDPVWFSFFFGNTLAFIAIWAQFMFVSSFYFMYFWTILAIGKNAQEIYLKKI